MGMCSGEFGGTEGSLIETLAGVSVGVCGLQAASYKQVKILWFSESSWKD